MGRILYSDVYMGLVRYNSEIIYPGFCVCCCDAVP